MGRASSRKKAKRAARDAATRPRRRRRRWPLTVLVLVVIGVAVAVLWSTGRLEDIAGAEPATASFNPDRAEDIA